MKLIEYIFLKFWSILLTGFFHDSGFHSWQAFSQGVKTGRPKNTVSVATYFCGRGQKTWRLKSIVTYLQFSFFSTNAIKTYAIDKVNSSWDVTFVVAV